MIKFLTTACHAVCFAVLICMAKPATSAEIENNLNINLSADIKSDSSYQLAKATFLPDRYDDLGLSDYDSIKSIQPDKNCESYTLSSCPTAGLCERCPFDVRKFRAYACKAPYLMSNGDCVCPAETPLIYPNDKCTQYCGSRCIQKTCTPSADKTGCTNGTQNCDNGCGQNTRKCCVPCTHKLTSKPANSSYTYCSCTDDEGAKQIQCGCTCNPGYHLKNGTCGSGGICEKDCIANSCSGYTLATCPANATCSSCTKQTTGCDGGDTVFQKTGCQSGYKDCNGSCVSSSTCCGGCPSGQKCENGTCVAVITCNPQVGYVLYSDKSCSARDSSKSGAIGVIFDANRKLAVALEAQSLVWSNSLFDIPNLTNYSSAPKSDYNGKSNTIIAYNYCKENGKICPAVEYAYTYKTSGTKAGDWYVPGGGELQSIYNNKDALNKTLQLLGKQWGFYAATFWSSSEQRSVYGWHLTFSTNGWSTSATKSSSAQVVPVIAF